MKIPTFSPKDVDEFQKDIAWALMLAQDHNLSNLIVDLRDNGGGLNGNSMQLTSKAKFALDTLQPAT